jgi:Tfp pilus assembly protein PilE
MIQKAKEFAKEAEKKSSNNKNNNLFYYKKFDQNKYNKSSETNFNKDPIKSNKVFETSLKQVDNSQKIFNLQASPNTQYKNRKFKQNEISKI